MNNNGFGFCSVQFGAKERKNISLPWTIKIKSRKKSILDL